MFLAINGYDLRKVTVDIRDYGFQKKVSAGKHGVTKDLDGV